jgi:hypothetical protein
VPRKMNATRRRRDEGTTSSRSDPFFEQFKLAPGSYLYEETQGDRVLVKNVNNSSYGGARHAIPRRCLDCGLDSPVSGFAPVFNANSKPTGEILILVCNSCYDRRCLAEDLLERQREWLEADEARCASNRERSKRYRDRRKAG